MSTRLRWCDEDEIPAFLRACDVAFGGRMTPEDIDRIAPLFASDRSVVVEDGGTIVATAGSYPFSLTIPGAVVPTAGVTVVAVNPTHRRRGLLTEMMRAQLDDLRDRGEAVAALWASEGAIYGRFGYGMAATHLAIDVDRDRARLLRPPPPYEARLLDLDGAVKALPEIYDRVRPRVPGMVDRSEEWWARHRLADPEHQRDGGGPMFRVLVSLDGHPSAYALYRMNPDWRDHLPNGTLEVLEVVADGVDATHAIWSYLFGVDLIGRIQSYFEAPDTPLLLMMAEPARLRARIADSLWIRLVDAGAALAARGYAGGPSRLCLELTDDFCPWNTGAWTIATDEAGAAEVSRGGAPEIRLGASDLGATFLGEISFARLVSAGRAHEEVPGAAARADAMFRTARAPWCPEIF